jgi:hypothetical protein
MNQWYLIWIRGSNKFFSLTSFFLSLWFPHNLIFCYPQHIFELILKIIYVWNSNTSSNPYYSSITKICLDTSTLAKSIMDRREYKFPFNIPFYFIANQNSSRVTVDLHYTSTCFMRFVVCSKLYIHNIEQDIHHLDKEDQTS